MIWVLLLFGLVSVHSLTLVANSPELFTQEGVLVYAIIIKTINLDDEYSRCVHLQLLDSGNQFPPLRLYWLKAGLSDIFCGLLLKWYSEQHWLYPLVFPTLLLQRNPVLLSGLVPKDRQNFVVYLDQMVDLPQSMMSLVEKVADNPLLCGDAHTATLASIINSLWMTYLNNDCPHVFAVLSHNDPGLRLLAFATDSRYIIAETIFENFIESPDPYVSQVVMMFGGKIWSNSLTSNYFDVKRGIMEHPQLSDSWKHFWFQQLVFALTKRDRWTSASLMWSELHSLLESPQVLCPLIMNLLIPQVYRISKGSLALSPLQLHIATGSSLLNPEPSFWPSVPLVIRECWCNYSLVPKPILRPPLTRMRFLDFFHWWSDYDLIAASIAYDDHQLTPPLELIRSDNSPIECDTIVKLLTAVSEMALRESGIFDYDRKNREIKWRNASLSYRESKFLARLMCANLYYRGFIGIMPDGFPAENYCNGLLNETDRMAFITILYASGIFNFMSYPQFWRFTEASIWLLPPLRTLGTITFVLDQQMSNVYSRMCLVLSIFLIFLASNVLFF